MKIRSRRRLCRVAAAALACGLLAACGKKGPPLPPLRYVPGPATDIRAIRTGNEVRLQLVLPTRNAQGEGPVALDRVEIFAATVAPNSPNPPNRDLLTPKFLVGTLEVKPPAAEGEPAPGAAEDLRPAPGATATFVEALSDEKLQPQITTSAPAIPEAATAAAAAAAAAAPPVTRRIYIARGLTRGGRAGQPSARVVLPITEVPAPPADLAVTYTETGLSLNWTPPAAAEAGTPTFNVYVAGTTTPLNDKPLTSPGFSRPGVTFGEEECFAVRTAFVTGNATLESEPSSPVCVTPADTFAPAAPASLTAVGVAGAVNLIWERNAESDLAGYLVLRGEAPGDTLLPVTAAPITETTYRDTTAVPGVRYVYAVVAVDNATPPNRSAPSNRVEESAR